MDTDKGNLISDADGENHQNDEHEECACCHKKLEIPRNEEIELRPFYIEGAGQLCYDCYHELYGKYKTH